MFRGGLVPRPLLNVIIKRSNVIEFKLCPLPGVVGCPKGHTIAEVIMRLNYAATKTVTTNLNSLISSLALSIVGTH